MWKKSLISLVAMFGALLLSSCSITILNPALTLNGGDNGNNNNSGGTSDKDIISFMIGDSTGVISGTDIAVAVSHGTDVTALSPVITVSTGASVSPASGLSHNFTEPAIYTVTAADSSTKAYTVTVTVSDYALRDIGPAGGLIFYDKGFISDGWRYMEAAPTDIMDGGVSIAVTWSSVTDKSVPGGTGTAIGTGQTNTTNIVAQSADSTGGLCDALATGGYSDWFLPSKDELNQMYLALAKHGVGGFADLLHWSSSENSDYGVGKGAWIEDFNAGEVGGDVKWDGANCHVRCARAF